ncbi:MAG: thiamine pyrophosphate-binding protein [Bacillota bacterium]|nr:MAG: thiamine pyrophosphate-binding protein [Bacillota bacterium]
MTGADIAVRMLERYGVRHIFGLPGDTSMALYDAFRRASSPEHIVTRDERSSAYMADAYAKVTGRPGVCEGPSGGGALYIIPGVAEADGSRVPLVCLTTDTPLTSDDRGSLTSLDQTGLFRPVTRFTARVLMPEKIPETLRRAFRHATAERQGASHVALPEDVLSRELDGHAAQQDLYAEAHHWAFPAHRGTPPATDLEQAVELLQNASRPVIFCGGGLHMSAAWDELRRFAEMTSLPVATTLNGKGAIDELGPLALGVVGGNGGKAASNEAVQAADLVLVIGSRLNSTSTAGGSIFGDNVRLIQVDLDPAQIGNNFPVELGLAGDARAVLAAFISLVEERSRRSGGSRGSRGNAESHRPWAGKCRTAVEEEVQSYGHYLAADGVPFTPHRVIRALEKALPADSVLVCDAGTPTPYVAAFYRPASAGRLFVAGRAHGSLGYAVPAAIGAKVGAPDRPVVALFGDGSFAMACGEMETISRRQLPVVLLSFRNGCFSWIKCLQQIYYGERYFGVDFGSDVDYCEVARAYGIRAIRPASGPELEEELARAAAADRPTFIEATVQCMTRATPPVSAWQRDAALAPEDRRRKSY